MSKVAVVGRFADVFNSGDEGSSDAKVQDPELEITPFEGIRDAFSPGVTVTFEAVAGNEAALGDSNAIIVVAVFAHRSDDSVLVTAGIIVIVGAAGLVIYSFLGSLIHNLLSPEKWDRIMDVGFGALLCVVGIWIAFQPFIVA